MRHTRTYRIRICKYMHTWIRVLGWPILRVYFGWDISELHCISDNAKTFKASPKVIKQLYDNNKVRAHLESNQIDWKFILEQTLWWHGFYERTIGTVKRCFRKVLGKRKGQCWWIANSFERIRSDLEFTSGDIWLWNGAEMLTPSHLIHKHWFSSLPEEVRNEEEESEAGFLRRFRYLTRLRIHFWNQWRKVDIADLRQHHHSKEEGLGKLSEGEVLLVHKNDVKRSNWKMGKVVGLIIAKDREEQYCSKVIQTIIDEYRALFSRFIAEISAKHRMDCRTLKR